MSTLSRKRRITAPQIRARKGKEPIVSLTAYSAPVASYIDPYVDVFIVGDSVGMVLYGMDSTLGVTLEMMIGHGAAVVRGSEHGCVIVDLPFATYQETPALDDVSFRIEAGEKGGLIGRIGSGKSSIQRLVLGLYEPDQGAVMVDGTDVRQIDPADRPGRSAPQYRQRAPGRLSVFRFGERQHRNRRAIHR